MWTLKKQKNKDFVVLSLTDFNVSSEEMAEGCDCRKILEGTVRTLVKQVNPDFITFAGDFSYARDLQVYDTLGKMLESYQIPWSFVWGNHDNEALDFENRMEEITQILVKNPHCLYEKGPNELGNGNYVVEIIEEGMPIYAFIFMDSHNVEIDETNKNADGTPKRYWGRLWPNQLEWLEKTSQDLGVKNTIITHIPLPAFQTAFDEAWNKNFIPKEMTYADTLQSEKWNDGYKTAYGTLHEGICSYPYDGGEFEAVKRGKNTEIFLCGHDHVNTFVLPYQGVKFLYSLKTGSGGYWEKSLNGGTKITLTENETKIEHIFIDADQFL